MGGEGASVGGEGDAPPTSHGTEGSLPEGAWLDEAARQALGMELEEAVEARLDVLPPEPLRWIAAHVQRRAWG